MTFQIKLPSHSGGELKYVIERYRYTTYTTNHTKSRTYHEFDLTHRNYLTYSETDHTRDITFGDMQQEWDKSVDVAMGSDTVTLTGLRKGTRYRVGFWKTGASNFNISYVILKTRGNCCQI